MDKKKYCAALPMWKLILGIEWDSFGKRIMVFVMTGKKGIVVTNHEEIRCLYLSPKSLCSCKIASSFKHCSQDRFPA